MTYQTNKIYNYFHQEGNEKNNTNDGDHYFGMKHTIKASNVTRLWFTNPCGIGVDPQHPKSDTSFSYLCRKSKCDIFGLAETNVHWYLLYNHASLYARVKKRWKNFKLSTSHNHHEKIGKTQRGGTCTVSTGQVAFREYTRGQDDTKLGRWSWMELRGKNNHRTRVYTAYRPGSRPNKIQTAHTTVYQQHKRYMRGTEYEQMEPRDLFDLDICKEIKEHIEHTNIVLMIDVNQNIIRGKFTRAMKEIGMQSVFEIMKMGEMPATHHRGRFPISTIYVSKNLTPTRAGILPKTIGVQGDHRNMYVDITNETFLGDYMYKIVTQPMKRLQLKDMRTTKRFQDKVLKHLQSNNMLKHGLSLLQQSTYPCPPAMKDKLERFDEQLGRAIENGKRKCRKFRTGHIPYSKAFAKLRDTRRLWLLTYKKRVGQSISNTTIRRLSKKLRIYQTTSYSIQEIKDNMRKAEKEYKSLNRQTALQQRNQFNEELAVSNAIAMKVDKEKILKRIIYDEQIREQSRISRRFFPKRNQAGQKVDRIQYFDGSIWKEATSPRGVASACRKDTEAKYKETRSTPLMQPRIHDLLGNFAETEFSKNFRERKCELPENTSRWTIEMMEKVRNDENIPRLPIPMSPDEIKAVWQTVKEHKAASPSGRYNGVYKALCGEPHLLQVLTISMNLPFLNGHPYKRWHSMVDIMAFKKQDNIKVSNIRSIIISEADWNSAGKIQVTRRMMKQAEARKLLPPEHMGGRKGRKATDGVLTKRLILDNSRITKRHMIIISTDAANCYDRMLHKYISFIGIKWGLAVQVMIALLLPLQKATHYTRTAYGDSSKSFIGDNLQGAGQGNTGAAPFWTAISTPMIELMKEYGVNAEFVTPISGTIVLLALLAFVDDTELFLTCRDKETIENFISRAEGAINMWREILYVTGGIMRATKCSWTLMAYDGTWLKPNLLQQHKHKGDIHMPDEDGNVSVIPRYDVHDPRIYLGVVQTTSGEEIEQEKVLITKIEEWNHQIQQSKLPPALNMNALMSKIHRSIIYPLPATTMTEEKLQKMSDKLYWESLPKCGIVRTFPIDYRHLPNAYQGLDLPTLYLEQEISKLMEIITFGKTDSVLWKQLSLGLENIQLRIGLQDLVLNSSYKEYSFMCPDCWIKTVWKFMSERSLTIQGWKNTRTTRRENDAFLIQQFIQHRVPQEDIITLNECRIYLQVETLSDITDGNGLRIAECYYKGRKDPYRTTGVIWPYIRRPNVNKWLIWSKWLDEIFCRSASRKLLRKTLGPWKHISIRQWKWFYDETCDTLYLVINNNTAKRYTQSSSNRSSRGGKIWYQCRNVIILENDMLQQILSLHPAVTCNSRGNRVQLDGWSRITKQQKTPENTSLISRLKKYNVPQWMYARHNFGDFGVHQDVCNFVQSGLRVVTDASLNNVKGTACVIIESVDQKDNLTFVTKVPANISGIHPNDSYRSELFGILASLTMIEVLEKITGQRVAVELACDNLRAIQVTRTIQYVNTRQQHFDVIRAILEIKKRLVSKISYVHVRGHQDKTKKFEDMTRLEQLNVLCDRYAKEANEYLQHMPPVHLNDEGLSLWHKDMKIYSSFKQNIRKLYWDIEAKRIICAKYGWQHSTFSEICWNASERAMRMMSSQVKIRIAKFVTHTLPVGRIMERRGVWKQSFCPRCSRDNETPHHVIQCHDESTHSIKKRALQDLEMKLNALDTEPTLQSELIICVSKWITTKKVVHNDTITPIRMQTRLGWNHFMEGRVHLSFQTYMDNYYANIGSKKNGELWVAAIIQTIWTKIFEPMWKHRNDAAHCISTKEKKSREVLNLNFSIQELHAKAASTTLLHQDKY